MPNTIEITHQTLRLFWSRNRVSNLPPQSVPQYAGLDRCWDWSGTLSKAGYGKIKVGDVHTTAHRISWAIHYGPVPEGMCVLHKCDNRCCVNPNHLMLGTIEDNNLDRVAKGRSAPLMGSALPQAKLTDDQVRQIREMYRIGLSQSVIGAKFNMAQQSIQKITSRRLWKHVK
jgi:hypothetical protein